MYKRFFNIQITASSLTALEILNSGLEHGEVKRQIFATVYFVRSRIFQ